ncbi:MAG: TIGR03086 family metal-binding protein [Candidatus Dormibacteraceae bacterium]
MRPSGEPPRVPLEGGRHGPPVSYRRCVEELDKALSAVSPAGWEMPTPCDGWSIRDIAGHVVWGQEQLRCWVRGDDYQGLPGGPGTAQPATIAGGAPLPRWRAARANTDQVLRDARLDQTIPLPGLGERPLTVMLEILANDALIHAWDVHHAAGDDTRLPADLVAASHLWARDNLVRMPGFFGPELTAPAGADEQTRWLAYLGRASWQRAHTEVKA